MLSLGHAYTQSKRQVNGSQCWLHLKELDSRNMHTYYEHWNMCRPKRLQGDKQLSDITGSFTLHGLLVY